MIYHDLIIIGAGASGLVAAILAKDFGLDVALLEGTDRVGRKILTTGNGRCNISNSKIKAPFKNNYLSNNLDFYSPALASFSVSDTKNFFMSLGLPIIELEKGKMYPQSLQASSVVDILRLSLEERNIPVYTNCKVTNIHKGKKFKLSTNNDDNPVFNCGKLLLCCGGKTASKTGSDGSGYKLACELGHSLVKPLPGLVQLKLESNYLKALAGIKFDGKVSLFCNNDLIRTESGEILFTDYGISGPPIMQISKWASRVVDNSSNVFLSVDMFPNKSDEEVKDFFETHLNIFSYRSIHDSLIGVINKKLIPTIIKSAGIMDIHRPCYDLSYKEKSSLISLFKSWKFKCIGTKDFSNAQVTLGGIDTHDVFSETLESKIVPNLYFAGEILDVDGDCGGFNLQWAWSSAYLAIKSISSK